MEERTDMQLALFASVALATAGGAWLAPHAATFVHASLDCHDASVQAASSAHARARHAEADADADAGATTSFGCFHVPRSSSHHAPAPSHAHKKHATSSDGEDDDAPCPHEHDDDGARDAEGDEPSRISADVSVDVA
jgi:hypothetical protein